MPSAAHGHWWTIAPSLRGRLFPAQAGGESWSTFVSPKRRDTTAAADLRIAGRLCRSARRGADARDLYLIVHGLGGSADQPYMRDAAAAVSAIGQDSLRISMRGAGHSGADFYHAGLDADLDALLADPSLAHYTRVFVMGFSLGGHIAMRLGLPGTRDPRIRAVVAICAPLDLGRNVDLMDEPSGWLYRRYVLDGLEEIHRRVHGHSPRFRKVREWDARVVVPRFGFDDADHYYRSQSVGPRLRELELPTLYVATERDPMVPAKTLEPHLRRAGDRVDVRWLRRGGHVGFPANTDLGMPGKRGLYEQALAWCAKVG